MFEYIYIIVHYYINLVNLINNNYTQVCLMIIYYFNIEKMFPYVTEGEKSACFLSAV